MDESLELTLILILPMQTIHLNNKNYVIIIILAFHFTLVVKIVLEYVLGTYFLSIIRNLITDYGYRHGCSTQYEYIVESFRLRK